MKLTTRMIRGTERAEQDNGPVSQHIINMESHLLAALQTCPVHFNDAQCARRLRTTVGIVRLMKDLAQALSA